MYTVLNRRSKPFFPQFRWVSNKRLQPTGSSQGLLPGSQGGQPGSYLLKHQMIFQIPLPLLVQHCTGIFKFFLECNKPSNKTFSIYTLLTFKKWDVIFTLNVFKHSILFFAQFWIKSPCSCKDNIFFLSWIKNNVTSYQMIVNNFNNMSLYVRNYANRSLLHTVLLQLRNGRRGFLSLI